MKEEAAVEIFFLSLLTTFASIVACYACYQVKSNNNRRNRVIPARGINIDVDTDVENGEDNGEIPPRYSARSLPLTRDALEAHDQLFRSGAGSLFDEDLPPVYNSVVRENAAPRATLPPIRGVWGRPEDLSSVPRSIDLPGGRHSQPKYHRIDNNSPEERARSPVADALDRQSTNDIHRS